MPDAEDIRLPATLDSVLRKYGKIWIWSILSAAVAAFSIRSYAGVLQVSMLAFNGARPASFSGAAIPMFLFGFFQMAAVLYSVYYLLLSLRHHILPILFPPAPTAPPEAGFTLTGAPSSPEPKPAAEPVPDGAMLLYRAFLGAVVAVAADAAVGATGILTGLGRSLFG